MNYSTTSSIMETGESSSQGANGKYGDSIMSPYSFELYGSPTTTTRSDRSTRMTLLIRAVALMRHRLLKAPVEPAGSPRLKIPPSVLKNRGIKVSQRKVGKVWVYNVRSATAAGVRNPHHNDNSLKLSVDTRTRILVFAGGGFKTKPTKEHWQLCEFLATSFPYDMVSLISCPLAPKSSAPEAFPLLLETYKTLAREATGIGENIALVGDSSGGNLCLTIAMAALGESERMFRDYAPIKIVLISPAVDLTHKNPEIKEVEKLDPLLSLSAIEDIAKTWSGSWSRDDPRISPINGDLTLIRQAGVEVNVVSGTWDVLNPDIMQLKDLCEKYGIKGEWLIWEKQMHCFPLTAGYGLKEGIQARKWIVDRLKDKGKGG